MKTDNLSSARKARGKTWYPTKTLHNNTFHNVGKNENTIKMSTQKINETKSAGLPSLIEVSKLFKEFYHFAKHYPGGKDKENLQGMFMKILEEYTKKYKDSVDKTNLRNFYNLLFTNIQSQIKRFQIPTFTKNTKLL